MIYLILLIELRENPIFVQERSLSLKHPRFKIYKFRTMSSHAVPVASSVFIKDKDDYDVKGFRLWLRKAGIDELPQILNIIKGEMNLIGPRPFTIPDIEILKEFNESLYQKREVIKSKPGITGYWQVFGDRNSGLKNLIAMDKFYDENKNFKLKLQIIVRTLRVLFFAKHSDSLLSYSLHENETVSVNTANKSSAL